MKLLRLLKEIEVEFDHGDDVVYQRKLAMKKIKDYIANGSKGNLDLINTPITSLGNLKTVGGGGYLDLRNTPITSLGNLKSVGGVLDLENTPLTSLGNLESVGSSLLLKNTPLTSLGNLKSVGGYLDLKDSKILDHYTEEQIRAQVKIGGRIYK